MVRASGKSDDSTLQSASFGGLLLRRADQAAIAVLLTASLVTIVGSLLYRGYQSGNLIEIDRADPKKVTFSIDINIADWPEFTLLPGVGETLARRIIQSRDEQGPFADHEDLLRVKGVGPRTLNAIRPHLMPLPDAESMAGPTESGS
jgi:competence protein ComEA